MTHTHTHTHTHAYIIQMVTHTQASYKWSQTHTRIHHTNGHTHAGIIQMVTHTQASYTCLHIHTHTYTHSTAYHPTLPSHTPDVTKGAEAGGTAHPILITVIPPRYQAAPNVITVC